jgi:hypothetical protein
MAASTRVHPFGTLPHSVGHTIFKYAATIGEDTIYVTYIASERGLDYKGAIVSQALELLDRLFHSSTAIGQGAVYHLTRPQFR